jgi:hypothetical protein
MSKDEWIRIAASLGVAFVVLPLLLRGERRKTWIFPVASAVAVAVVVGALILFGRDW